MKLLIITQKVDNSDPVLGFFHGWIEEFSHKFSKITVICLQEGVNNLPGSIEVLSLGKELGCYSKYKYIQNFYKYIWQKRNQYDSVFVHMNQEYVLLGFVLWKILKKTIYLWRNHYKGNLITDIAMKLCNKFFCTSKFSYTNRSNKAFLVPVGIDTNLFKANPALKRINRSILFIGRISPSKNLHILIESLINLNIRGVDFTASIYGDPLPLDEDYYNGLRNKVSTNNLESKIKFHNAIPNHKTPYIYSTHEIFVNISNNGMFDKTIFEAMLCRSLILSSSADLVNNISNQCIVSDLSPVLLSNKIDYVLNLSREDKELIANNNAAYANKHSLAKLSSILADLIN